MLLSTEANTRTRRRAALACAYLADYAEIEHDLRRLTGKYSAKRVSPQDLSSRDVHQRVYDILMSRSDRPLPPQ